MSFINAAIEASSCFVLADDPHTVSKDKIKDIQVVRTVVGASTTYQA